MNFQGRFLLADGLAYSLGAGDEACFEQDVGSPERARFARYLIVSESEGLTPSAVLPRWGKTSVPARNMPRQDPPTS